MSQEKLQTMSMQKEVHYGIVQVVNEDTLLCPSFSHTCFLTARCLGTSLALVLRLGSRRIYVVSGFA